MRSLGLLKRANKVRTSKRNISILGNAIRQNKEFEKFSPHRSLFRQLYWVEENKMTLRDLFEAQITIIRIARPFSTPSASAQNRRS